MTLTPAPEFLSVVVSFFDRLAEQRGFGRSERLALKQGLQQACRRFVASEGEEAGGELSLEFSGFEDRLEIELEGGQDHSEMEEADLYLLNQVFDRVVEEDTTEGGTRLTLVAYRARGGGPS